MITIIRRSSPRVLLSNPNNVDRFSHKSVVKTLVEMQNRKCCYCESDLPTDGLHKHVEHIKPKSKYTSLRNSWENLLLACSQCNGNKKESYPLDNNGNSLFVDPSKEDPEQCIGFYVDFKDEEYYGLPMALDKDLRAEETIKTLNLRDKYYRKKHRAMIRILARLLLRLQEAIEIQNIPDISDCKAEIKNKMKADRPWAGVARAFAQYYKLDQSPYNIKVLKLAEK